MLTTHQLERIRALREDDDALDVHSRLALLADVESSEELHLAIEGFPLSLSEEVFLSAIVAHPLCSEGTALMIYWGLNPGRVYRRLSKGQKLEPDFGTRLPLLREIEARVKERRFRGAAIPFSFAAKIGRSLAVEEVYNPGIRLVPSHMKSGSSTHG